MPPPVRNATDTRPTGSELSTGGLAVSTIVLGSAPSTSPPDAVRASRYVVVISEDTERYLHVHPNDQADKGPVIGFNTNFEKPGLYRVFLQFNHGGQIHTGDFTINVKA